MNKTKVFKKTLFRSQFWSAFSFFLVQVSSQIALDFDPYRTFLSSWGSAASTPGRPSRRGGSNSGRHLSLRSLDSPGRSWTSRRGWTEAGISGDPRWGRGRRSGLFNRRGDCNNKIVDLLDIFRRWIRFRIPGIDQNFMEVFARHLQR